MAFSETLRLILDVDAARGKREVDDFTRKTSTNLSRVGSNMAKVGGTLNRQVTLPIVAVGAAATKMALDFDSVFVQMQSLAGATADEIDGMKESVLDLAGETGKSPRELAEALYFLRSSGLDAEQALEALEVAAKGSAAGLGSTIQVADAVSSAMNAYAKSGLSAAEATDVLVATAREGKAEPAELAAQMGRLLPLSSELGITFQDVGAALAALSLSGNDAASASTLLTNIMAKLLKPSMQAMEIMDGVGISLGDIRTMIAEKGLLGTLETLRASLGDAGFTKFLEDAQAVQGGLALTGQNVEKNREIFDALNDSVGATDEAFAKWAESMGAQNAQAWAKFQAALIRLGDTLAPIATDLISFASDLLEAFDSLPGPLKSAVAGLVLIAAAAGPLLTIGGRMVQVWVAFSRVWSAVATWASGAQAFAAAMNQGSAAAGGMVGGVSRLSKALGAVGLVAAVGAAIVAVRAFVDAQHDKSITDAAKQWEDMGSKVEDLTEKQWRFAEATGNVQEVFDKLVDTNTAAAARFLEAAEANGVQADTLREMRDALAEKADADKQAATDAEANTRITEQGAEAFDEEAIAIDKAVTALEGYSDQLKAMFDPLFGMVDALSANRDAQDAVVEAQAVLNQLIKEGKSNSEEAAEAQRDLDSAMIDAGKSALDVTHATSSLNAAIAENPTLLGQAKEMLGQWVQQGLLTQQQAAFLAATFDRTAERAVALGKTDPVINVGITGAEKAFFDIRSIQDRINALRGRDVPIRIVGTQVGVAIPGGGIFHEGGVVPGPRGQEVAAVLQAGEEVLALDDPRNIANARFPTFASPVGVGAMGAGSARVVIDITGGDDMLLRWLRNRVRVEGRGDVQVALGQRR